MTWQANLSLKSNKKWLLPSTFMCLIDCLFAWAFTSNLRIVHSYGDVTITSEGLQFSIFNSAIDEWGLFNVPHLLWHGPTFYYGHLRSRTRDTHSCCKAFCIEAVTTCLDRGSNPNLPCARQSFNNYATAAVI